MKNKSCACLALVTLVAFANAHAGYKQGRITSVLVQTNTPNLAFIKVDGPYVGEPACSSGVTSWDFVLDTTTTSGKTLYALALAAQAAGTNVYVAGTNTCVLYTASYEDLHYMHTYQ